MIFAASWAVSARLHSLFRRFAPSNILIRRVHTRTGIKWGPLVGLAAAVLYGLLMLATATVVRKGGSGWVDLIVLLAFWNTVKFTCLIPVSLIQLVRVRHQERVLQRNRQRTTTAGATPAGTIHERADTPLGAVKSAGQLDTPQAHPRLVQEQQPRTVKQRQRQIQASLHTPGVAVHLAISGFGEPYPCQQFAAALHALALGQPVQSSLQTHVLAAGQERIERGLLLGAAPAATP